MCLLHIIVNNDILQRVLRSVTKNCECNNQLHWLYHSANALHCETILNHLEIRFTWIIYFHCYPSMFTYQCVTFGIFSVSMGSKMFTSPLVYFLLCMHAHMHTHSHTHPCNWTLIISFHREVTFMGASTRIDSTVHLRCNSLCWLPKLL